MPENVKTKANPADIPVQQAERKQKETALATLKRYALSPEVQKRFENMLGDRSGKTYIESVIIAVTGNDELQKCDPKSIMVSAMRAASLKLSVDPALKQAHLVPFNKSATLIVDYHGLVQLTAQTGMYRSPPNVSPVFEGEVVDVDRFTGIATISGGKRGDKVIGWVGYFQDVYNNERYLYMTNEECDAHGKRYNPGGFNSSKSAWGTDRDKMRRKTVLRQLVSKWGYFSPATKQVIFDDTPELIEARIEDMPEAEIVEPEPSGRTEQDNMEQLGFGGE